MQIRVRVDKEVIILKTEQIGTNNVNTIECIFELCEEFNNLVPVALFTKNDTTYKVNIVDNKCIIPHEILKSEGEVEFGVYGFEVNGQDLVKRYSPIPTKLFVKKGSYKEGQESVDASPNSFEYYLTACNNAKNTAETSASNAQTSENNAKVSEENAKLSEEKAKQSEENAKLSENNAKESEKEVENIKNSIVTEENKRVENENARVTAESERTAAENKRVTVESERAIAETKRLENEEQREENETDRIRAEETRIIAEEARVRAEIERTTAETERNENEEIIIENEKARIENENIRNANEETRVANENLRIANETSREEERKVHNNMLDTLLKDMQIEDTDINVKDSADYPCTLNVEGKSEQEVTENSPSLEYPSPIENVSGDLEIKIIGKNTWKQPEDLDLRDVAVGHSNPYKINEILTLYQYGSGATLGTYFKNNSIILNTSKADIVRGKISGLKANTTYTISYLLVTNATKSLYRTLLSNRAIQTKEFNKMLSFVFTTNENGEFGRFTDSNSSIVWLNQDERPQIEYRDIQLEEGDTATEYEKYKEQTVTFPLAEGQKMYKDSYLADDGIHHKRRHFSLAVADMNNSEEYPGWRNLPNLQDDFPGKNVLLSDVTNYCSNVCKSQDKNLCINTNGNGATMFFKANLGLTQSQLKTQYSDLIVEVEYEMREKEETTAYTTEQQKAYEQIKALRTYRTVTNISNNQNTNMKLTYKKDLQTQFQELETMLLESGV